MDCSLAGSSVHGISQAILEWVAISFSRASSQWKEGSNPGLLHCRLILYHLVIRFPKREASSPYQGSTPPSSLGSPQLVVEKTVGRGPQRSGESLTRPIAGRGPPSDWRHMHHGKCKMFPMLDIPEGHTQRLLEARGSCRGGPITEATARASM